MRYIFIAKPKSSENSTEGHVNTHIPDMSIEYSDVS